MAETPENGSEAIRQGAKWRIDVDGSYFGRRKFGSQRLVIGAINPMTNRIRLKVIPYRSRKCAEDFITRAIKERSLVITDGYKGYDELLYWATNGKPATIPSASSARRTI